MAAMETEETPGGAGTKIDMSLDDIIKLQREESDPGPSTNQRGPSGRTRNFNFRSNRFYRGPARQQQGLGRPKAPFRQQRFNNFNARTRPFGPLTRQRAAGSLQGVSPLNRPGTPSGRPAGAAQTQKRQQIVKRFPASAGPRQTPTRRNSVQSIQSVRGPPRGPPRAGQSARGPPRGPPRAGQRIQRPGSANQPNRKFSQQVAVNRGKRQLNTGRWQNSGGAGTTLTVSVPNPKANRAPPALKTGMKQPPGRFRKPGGQPAGRLPKGVPLRFNFRAMANHTQVTLNDRFSTLSVRGRFSPAGRGRGRTVTIA